MDFIGKILSSASSPWEIFWLIFIYGGWVIFLVVILWGICRIWLTRRQMKYAASVRSVMLAIDIPKDNEQSPKAVEQIFAHLSGAHKPPDWLEKWYLGMFQLSFSFELISIEGHIQFLIRTPADYRDLVESAIYAQYPGAKITEVNDYATEKDIHFPNEEYDLWGTELATYNKDAYPIRTYPEFEHALSQEFKDPMAAILETLSSLKKGEQVWFQLLLMPTGNDWQKKGVALMNKMAGMKTEKKKSKIPGLGILGQELQNIYSETVTQVLNPGEAAAKPTKAKAADESGLKLLAPQERTAIEAIQRKVSKIGFLVKWRIIYLAKKEVYSAARVATSIVGAIKQFNTLDFNGFKPENLKYGVKVGHHPWAKKRKIWKQNKIMHAYRDREWEIGHHGYVLNTEELATIWHFPVMVVKAPQIARTEAKRAEPPSKLPVI